MNNRPVQAALLSLALLGAAGSGRADEPVPAPKAQPAPQTPAPTSKAQPAPAPKPPTSSHKKAKPAPKGHLVELNSASKAELMTLPGITDALADRIIAARPYYSKAKLNVGVLPQGYYGALHAKVMVKPPALPPK